jgi:bacillolysin
MEGLELSEKQAKAVAKLMGIDPDCKIFWDKRMKIPKFIKGRLSGPSSEIPDKIATNFLEENRGLLKMQEGLPERLEISVSETDFSGFHHVIFLQYLYGTPVFEGSVQIHINPAGEVIAYKDFRVTELVVSHEPKIRKDEAFGIVINDIGSDHVVTFPGSRLMFFRDRDKRIRLVWQVESIFAGGYAGRFHFIDAHTGEILYKFSQIRGALSRKTYSAHNKETLPGELILENDQTTPDEVARAAHENMAAVYRYYKDNFGRDSYDNRGAPLVSTVHFKRNYNNSFWSDFNKQLVFGDGDGYRWSPLAFALDIVAHELTHAIAANTAKFVYSEEAGALEESFADFFAVMISNREKITDWEIGEGVYTPFYEGDALRDLSDPPRFGQPDHMDNFMRLAAGEIPDLHKNESGYIHHNSGIPNKVAYLITAGGMQYGIEVRGILRKKAEKIYYLALTAYLCSATLSRWTFKEARYALLNACRQLYGEEGPEFAAIKNAWAAVGLGQPTGDLLIVEGKVSLESPIPIQDMDPAGILSSIYIEEDGLVKDIRLSVNIEHSYTRDLIITLLNPVGGRVVLHDRKGLPGKNIVRTYNLGSVPKLRTCIGERVQGEWALKIADNAKENTGSLVRWSLKFLVQKAEKKELSREIFLWQEIPDNDPKGIESQIDIERPGKIVNLDISLGITHSWIGDLRVILVMPSGEKLMLHNRTGYSRREIKKVCSTKYDETLQAAISKEMKGTWTLKIMDLAERDTGTLDSWGMCIVYE